MLFDCLYRRIILLPVTSVFSEIKYIEPMEHILFCRSQSSGDVCLVTDYCHFPSISCLLLLGYLTLLLFIFVM